MVLNELINRTYNINEKAFVKCRYDKKIVVFSHSMEANVLEGQEKQLLIKFNGGNTYASVCKTDQLKKKYKQSFLYLIEKQYLVETEGKRKVNLTPKWTLDEVFLELSKNCNLHCRHCYIPNGITEKEIKLKQWKRIVDQCHELEVGLIKITGGEPMLSSYFWDIVSYIHMKNIRMRIYTNGSYLNRETIRCLKHNGINEIQISLDGGTEKTHDSFRRTKGNFSKIMEALPILSNIGISVILSFTLSDFNEHEVKLFLQIAYRYTNVKVVINPYINYHQTCLNENILNISDTMIFNLKNCFQDNKLKWSDKTKYYLSFSNRFIGFCGLGTYMLYIDSTANVYLCPLLNQKENVVGNLNECSLVEVWEKSELLNQYRRYTIADIEGCNACKNSHICRGGCRARAFMESNTLLAKDSISCKMY